MQRKTVVQKQQVASYVRQKVYDPPQIEEVRPKEMNSEELKIIAVDHTLGPRTGVKV